MSTAKKVSLIAAIALVLVIGSWGVVFASAERLVTLSPDKSGYVSDEQPQISANWGIIPGVSLSDAKVFLDGNDVTDQAKKTDTGFILIPKSKLAQGKHTVEAQLTYNVLMNREVSSRWSFTVDTEPPPISFSDNAAFVVSPEADFLLRVKSEPGATLKISLNGKKLPSLTVNKDGNFSVKLANLDKENELKLEAADEIGNLRTIVIPVIKDETTPTIASLIPGEGETVRMQSPKLAVGFNEEDSGLKLMRLSIDGTLAVEKEWSLDKEISYLGRLLNDGTHKAKVEAVDYAGRSVVKEWTFNVDSRKIVINRGEFKLYFYRNGGLVKVYPVAVGMPGYQTPTGKFKIVSKQKNPAWYNPGSAWAANMPKIIPPGPGNPLGTRAMGISAPNIFIHGTYDAGSVGRAASHGCIRMYIRDAEELFEMVAVGIPVDVVN